MVLTKMLFFSFSSLDKAEDLCRKKKPKQALPYLYAAIAENPDNLDAAIQFAFLNDRKGALEILEASEVKGVPYSF